MADRIRDAGMLIAGHVEEKFRQSGKRRSGPLFVMLGGHEKQAAHKLTQMMALRELQERGHKVAVGFADPYSLARSAIGYIRDNTRSSFADDLEARLKGVDRDSPLHLSIADSLMKTESAYLTRNVFRYAGEQSEMKIAFNDAARENYNLADTIDMTDAYLQQVMADAQIMDAGPVNAHTPRGVQLRNRVIVDLAQDHAVQRRPSIYIQLCGNHQVAGMRQLADGPLFPYGQSLLGLYQSRGQAAMGIHIFHDQFKRSHCPKGGKVAVWRGPTLEGPSFSGWDNPLERAWLQAVLPHLMPGLTLESAMRSLNPDEALSRKALNARSRSI